MIDRENVAYLVELRGVYDGWSIAVMKDGSRVNRWDKKDYPKRWAATQAVLDAEGDDND